MWRSLPSALIIENSGRRHGSAPCRQPSSFSGTAPGRKLVKAKHDFSKGERGKFYHPEAAFGLPVYLDTDVSDFMSRLADEQDVDVQELVNEWLRLNIQLVRSVQRQG